ncbi:conserved hypothetical protein [Culex quinquefasciatus]|uniref:Uncharacterized protein n=1 Tax=Culex quinquefasciatus TaxID=7176 RepID=B0WMB2_CULQU|nr:conserved hypothetical protein [Culex quinquefasciatus]|eukprot:XP_001849846.1 conserved hypothetical protein [Culex quinquefasciatus]
MSGKKKESKKEEETRWKSGGWASVSWRRKDPEPETKQSGTGSDKFWKPSAPSARAIITANLVNVLTPNDRIPKIISGTDKPATTITSTLTSKTPTSSTPSKPTPPSMQAILKHPHTFPFPSSSMSGTRFKKRSPVIEVILRIMLTRNTIGNPSGLKSVQEPALIQLHCPKLIKCCLSATTSNRGVGESDNGNILLGLIPPISTGCPAQAPCLFHKRFPARPFNKDSDSEIVDFLEDEGAVMSPNVSQQSQWNEQTSEERSHLREHQKSEVLQPAGSSQEQSPKPSHDDCAEQLCHLDDSDLPGLYAGTLLVGRDASTRGRPWSFRRQPRLRKLLENSPKHRHRSHTISACVNGDQEQQCTMISADQTHVVAAHNETNLCGYDSYLHQTICAAVASAKHVTLHGVVLGGALTALPSATKKNIRMHHTTALPTAASERPSPTSGTYSPTTTVVTKTRNLMIVRCSPTLRRFIAKSTARVSKNKKIRPGRHAAGRRGEAAEGAGEEESCPSKFKYRILTKGERPFNRPRFINDSLHYSYSCSNYPNPFTFAADELIFDEVVHLLSNGKSLAERSTTGDVAPELIARSTTALSPPVTRYSLAALGLLRLAS